jgi:hypothetical protein
MWRLLEAGLSAEVSAESEAVVRCCWSDEVSCGRVSRTSCREKETPGRAQLEHITAALTVGRDQGKRPLAQRIVGENCKAGALPAELHPR